jgi:hypothetical protein
MRGLRRYEKYELLAWNLTQYYIAPLILIVSAALLAYATLSYGSVS